jgi:hypothetical protein
VHGGSSNTSGPVHTLEVAASHVAMISHPDVTELIDADRGTN